MNRYILLILLLAVGALAYLFYLPGAVDPFAGKKDNAEIRLGVISVLSGEFAYIGQSWVNGIRLAHREYIDSDPDIDVQLFFEDDGFQSARGIAAYRKLTGANRIEALLNLSTPTLSAITPLVTEAGFPVMQWAEGENPQRNNIFQIQPSFIKADEELGLYLAEQNLSNPLIVYSDMAINVRVAEAIWTNFGKTIIRYELPASEVDFRTHVPRIMQSNPSHIILALDPGQSALLIRELFSGSRKKPEIIHSSVFHAGVASYETILGDLSPLHDDLTIMVEKPRSAEFILAYRHFYGEEPGIASDSGYDAFNLLMSTYDPDSRIWTENVRSFSGPGVSGEIFFDEVGLRSPRTRITTVKEVLKLLNEEARHE